MASLSVDQLYVKYVASRRGAWDDFRARHSTLFNSLYQGYRLYRLAREARYHRVYRRFSGYTMIPKHGYVANLSLCDRFRHVPGAVVECGTWRGGMIAGIATIFSDARDYYLFDSFEGLPAPDEVDRDVQGRSANEWRAATTHNCRADEESALEAMRLSGARNVHVRKGWFNATLPKYSGEPIAILRVDGDWYESTMDILTHLYPYVVKGGVIIFDDYYYWVGCSKAVHDFLSRHQLDDTIHKYQNLYAYMVKSA
jgi:O-methyltransferase